MILHRANNRKGGEPQGSPSLSSSSATPLFADMPFLLLLADYCRHLASARKRSILAGELASYWSLADDDDSGVRSIFICNSTSMFTIEEHSNASGC